MNLIFIYGPPAVGKYTVAQALAERTGYRLMDNHAIVNPIASVFGWDHPERKRLGELFRLELYATAARSKINLITTFGGGGQNYDDFIQGVKAAVEGDGGQVLFVRLYAPESVLYERVSQDSRYIDNKMTTVEELTKKLQATPDVTARAMIDTHLEIDASQYGPTEMVRMIMRYYHVPPKNSIGKVLKRILAPQKVSTTLKKIGGALLGRRED